MLPQGSFAVGNKIDSNVLLTDSILLVADHREIQKTLLCSSGKSGHPKPYGWETLVG